jgi:hypothetical protein
METDGSDQRWHDFSRVDAVVTLRSTRHPGDEKKPPTRIVNAWCAGSIPLANDEIGVRELAHDGEDALIVGTGEELKAAVVALAQDPALRRRLFVAARRRGLEFDQSVVLDQWASALEAVEQEAHTRIDALTRVLSGIRLLPTLGYWAMRRAGNAAMRRAGLR